MAHFARLNNDNEVLDVIVISNEDILDSNNVENEQLGIDLCHSLYDNEHPNCTYKQTSYNTRGRKHYQANSQELSTDQTKAFRGNYAEVGGTYDPSLDSFVPEKKYSSWVFDNSTYTYIPPTTKPTTEGHWKWNITDFDTGEGMWVDGRLEPSSE